MFKKGVFFGLLLLAGLGVRCSMRRRVPVELRVGKNSPDIMILVYYKGMGKSLQMLDGRFVLEVPDDGVFISATHPGYGEALDFVVNEKGTRPAGVFFGNGERTIEGRAYEYFYLTTRPDVAPDEQLLYSLELLADQKVSDLN